MSERCEGGVLWGGNIAARAAVSYAAGCFTPAGLIYNAVDMLVSLVALCVLGNVDFIKYNEAWGLLAPVIGCLAGLAVTVLCFGTMSVVAAMALTVASTVQFYLNISVLDECCEEGLESSET